jgi:hypothetical protein
MSMNHTMTTYELDEEWDAYCEEAMLSAAELD